MPTKHDEARELVRQMVKERIADKTGVQTIIYQGEEVIITRIDSGEWKYSLPRLKKSYVHMSGRIYEREYINDLRPQPETSDLASPLLSQLNYRGEPEEVDTLIFKNRLVCSCGNVRYVKNADLFQVKKCKPCTMRERKMRRRASRDFNQDVP